MAKTVQRPNKWLVFCYNPVSLFSLKSSRATSTAGKTLLIPTPYSVKMAFLDAGFRHGLMEDPEGLVRQLASASLRVGVPRHACMTGTIQSVRQETRPSDRKIDPELPLYRASIAMREFVHYQDGLRVAFDLERCPPDLIVLLHKAAPAINYLGKRGGFVQYAGAAECVELDSSFTQPVAAAGAIDALPVGQRMDLDDFGPKATFAALNSFSPKAVRRGIERQFVDTIIPLRLYNSGPGFVHYWSAAGGPLD